MKLLKAFSNFLAKIEVGFLILLLSTMIILAFLQVILRNFFSSSLLWGDTLLRHLVLWVGFVGAALATREGKHITIDVLSRQLSPLLKRVAGLIVNFFAAVVCFFLMKAGINFIAMEKQSGGVLFAGIPIWIFQSIIAIGFGLMALRFCMNGIESLTNQKQAQSEGEVQ